MNKRILNFSTILITSLALTGSCKKEDNGIPYTYSSQVIVATNSRLDNKPANSSTTVADKYSIELLFSSDNGVTFSETPMLTPGKSYKVKLHHQNWGTDLTKADSYDFDWSGSKPTPTGDATGETADFTLAGANNVVVKIRDKYCTYDPAVFTGVWKGDEVGSCCSGTDTNNITQDPSDHNKLIMDNFWGDGVDAYFILTPSTSSSQYYDQKIIMPTQTTSEGGVASGTGYYDICRSQFTIATTYVIGNKSYAWQYNFHK